MMDTPDGDSISNNWQGFNFYTTIVPQYNSSVTPQYSPINRHCCKLQVISKHEQEIMSDSTVNDSKVYTDADSESTEEWFFTTVRVDQLGVDKAHFEVVEDSWLVEVAESCEVILPYQDVRIP